MKLPPLRELIHGNVVNVELSPHVNILSQYGSTVTRKKPVSEPCQRSRKYSEAKHFLSFSMIWQCFERVFLITFFVGSRMLSPIH